MIFFFLNTSCGSFDKGGSLHLQWSLLPSFFWFLSETLAPNVSIRNQTEVIKAPMCHDFQVLRSRLFPYIHICMGAASLLSVLDRMENMLWPVPRLVELTVWVPTSDLMCWMLFIKVFWTAVLMAYTGNHLSFIWKMPF